MQNDGNFIDVILPYLLKNGQEGGSAAPRTERGRMLVPPTPARSLSQQNAQGCTRLYVTHVHPYVITTTTSAVTWIFLCRTAFRMYMAQIRLWCPVSRTLHLVRLSLEWCKLHKTKFPPIRFTRCVFPALSCLCNGLIVINGHFWTNIMRQLVLQSVFVVTMSIRAIC
jgi:hypothetical protein